MKRYLNSVEEVLKALKEEKRVECDNDSCFELVDGLIVETKGDGKKAINAGIFFQEEGYKVYTEEPEPLKFEINRAYKTRNGYKVFLYEFEDKTIHFVGCSDLDFWTNMAGRLYANEEVGLDIIGYWEEEK